MSRAAPVALLLVALLLVALGGCDEPPPVAVEAPADPGRELVLRYECNRCHVLDDVPPADARADCVSCHREIAAGTFDAPADALADWRPHVEPLSHAPSLRGVGRRLRRSWIEQFLLHPHDLRPSLAATMPRLALDPEDAARIASYLAPERPPAPALDAAVADGRALFRARGCAGCHAFTGSGETPTDTPRGADTLAPDLRFTGDRMDAAAVVEQIAEPRRASPDGSMPTLVTDLDDARALAAFVLGAPLEPLAAAAVPERLPVLERPVAFAEVEARVFRRVCWHCHSDPDFALGDGGPGNHGGFGFAPRGLDLSSYQGVLAGGRDEDEQPASIFRRGPDGTPRLVETLLARQREERGEEVPGVRGMPLGLPSLSPEDIQLVETWIAQGRPM
ncbi:MAG: c-type cytochrome [Sandaracinaceae bacterium]|nr:c-type cytochrome [Sandaracinaceae bacterium]